MIYEIKEQLDVFKDEFSGQFSPRDMASVAKIEFELDQLAKSHKLPLARPKKKSVKVKGKV